MLLPITHTINNNFKKPLYDINDIIRLEPENIESWLDRDDVLIVNLEFLNNKEDDVKSELQSLEKLLNDIDNLEEEFKLK